MSAWDSRRASELRRSRSAAPASRSLRAWAASVSPCSIRALRWLRIFAIGLKANIQIRARKKMKLRAATMTQKKLMERPDASDAGAVAAAAARKFTSRAPSNPIYLNRSEERRVGKE